MKRVMGLDASTKTIGLSIIDYDETSVKLIHHEFYSPSKKDEIFEKLAKVRNFIFDKLEEFKPDNVALEDIIQFMKGFSTAKTIIALATLNRTVGLSVYNQSGKSPRLLNVLKIRHAIKKDKALPAKEEIPELVASCLGIPFPWIYKTNKKGVTSPKEENYDMADAIAVALAFIKISVVENQPKPAKKIKQRAIKKS